MAASDVWDYIFGSYVNAGVAALYITRRCYCDSKIEWLRYEATIPPTTRRDTKEEGRGGWRRRRTKGDAIDALLALGDNIARYKRHRPSRDAIEIANFSQIFARALLGRV